MVIRRKGLFFLFLIAVLITAIFALLNNVLVTWALNASGSYLMGAKVEFSGVHFNLFSLHLNWGRLQVTNPYNTWYNLFETGKSDVDIKAEPFLYKSFIMQTISVNDLRFNTRRKYNGALRGRSPQTTGYIAHLQDQLQAIKDQTPAFEPARLAFVNTDSLWRYINLKAPSTIDSLTAQVQSRYAYWSGKIDTFSIKKKAADLKHSIDSINVDSIRTRGEITSALNRFQDIKRSFDSLDAEIARTRDILARDIAMIRNSDTLVEASIKADIQRARSLARLPDITPVTISKAVFGPAVVDHIKSILTYIGIARYYNEKLKSLFPPKKPNPPHLKGQTITYSSRLNLPSFWIQSSSLTAQILKAISLSGTARNIVSNQALINEVTTVALNGVREGGISASLGAMLDYRGISPLEKFNIAAKSLPLDRISLSRSSSLPLAIHSGFGNFNSNITLNGTSLNAAIAFTANKLQFDLSSLQKNARSQVTDIEKQIASSISAVTLNATARSIGTNLDFTLNSDIGTAIAGALRTYIGTSLDSAEAGLRDRINSRIDGPRKRLTELSRDYSNSLSVESALLSKNSTILRNLFVSKKNALLEKARSLGLQKDKGIFGKPSQKLEGMLGK